MHRHLADQDRIVAEELPDEVMVVDLDTGNYYVLGGSAASAWPLLSRGATVAESAVSLSATYDATPEEIAAALTPFVSQLVGEGLVTPRPDLTAATTPLDPAPGSAVTAGSRRRFDDPVMTKYVDMANLVQMDPIREFEARRWPTKRTLRGTRRTTDDA